MEVEFGHVQEYNTERGFGFVSRTFRNANQRHKKNVWFHIKKIKCDYPNLAKELDAGSFANINFWYEVDTSDREKVGKVWLDPKDIPQQQRDSLFSHIEQLWCNPINALPEWLDSITIAVVGEVRKDELKKLYDEQIRKRNKVKEQEQIQRQSRHEQALRSNNPTQFSKAPAQVHLDDAKNIQIPSATERFRTERGIFKGIYSSEMHGLPLQRQSRHEQALRSNNPTQFSKAPAQVHLDDAKNIQIPSATERFRTERGLAVAIFDNELHGLPPELMKIVRPCPRGSRINPLSYEPGGSDVVVAYSLGDAILYDWIKDVERYISSFDKSNPEFHLHIQSIYGRFCEDKSERGFGVFLPIWYRDRDGAFKDAIKACLKRYQTQMNIGHKTLHEEAKNYWKTTYGLSDQEVENLPTLYKQHKQYMEEKRKDAMKARWERYQRKMDMRKTLYEKVSQESWDDDL
jgi:cold shock CspA family protein